LTNGTNDNSLRWIYVYVVPCIYLTTVANLPLHVIVGSDLSSQHIVECSKVNLLSNSSKLRQLLRNTEGENPFYFWCTFVIA
jgi:hypothetical protein